MEILDAGTRYVLRSLEATSSAAMEGTEPPSLSKEQLSPYLQELAAHGVIVKACYFTQEGKKTLGVVTVAHRSPRD